MATSPTPSSDLDVLEAFVKKLYPLHADSWQRLSSIWTPITVRRREILTQPGQTERYLYFVTEGVQRLYYTRPQDGRESTVLFTYAPSFSGVLDAFVLQQPARFAMEALTPSRMLRTHYQQWQEAVYPNTELMQLHFTAVAGALGGLMQRLAEWQNHSAEEKFRMLLQRSPHLLQLVPHKYIASYLGLDATTFSKLLASVKL